MNDEQDADSKSQVPGSQNQGGSSQSIPPNTENDRDGLNVRRNAAEIAGETVAVVGEATGQFQRPQIVERGERESTGRSAFMVGAGILISRIIGVVRQRVFAYYFGNSLAADAFTAAFRIPNFLQNVFGEGALSASFIPVYANLLARKDDKEASRVASAVLTLLALVTSVIVLLGVLATPYIISIVAWGFVGERRELAIQLVQIFFPGAGLLVMS
ncbi:MAG: lipid II flippase MurJ, partial [Acidobacteriota bacterium]